MIKLDANYTDYRTDTDPNFPFGKAVDAFTPDSVDGTPWKDTWFNDLLGSRTALFKRAFGNDRQPTNSPDSLASSDMADAIQKLIQDALASRLFKIEVSGTETVVAWGDLGINYDPTKNYSAVVTPVGNYEEFLPFGTECQNDGLHIYPRRLVDGKIVSGTRVIKWGSRKWGVGKWGEYATMDVNLQFAEVE